MMKKMTETVTFRKGCEGLATRTPQQVGVIGERQVSVGGDPPVQRHLPALVLNSTSIKFTDNRDPKEKVRHIASV